MSPLTVVLPYCEKDVDLAEKLLTWIAELGENKQFSMLLAADSKIPKERRAAVKTLALSSFGHVESLACPVAVEYPAAANAMMGQASNYVQLNYKTPFLWMEPDCVPLRTGWLHELAQAYYWSPKPFFGPFMHSADERFPKTHLNGVSIYPRGAWSLLTLKGDKAWDLASADKIVPKATDTKLINQFWGITEHPPTFVEKRVKDKDPGYFVTTKIIHESAVLFHRCKDATLIEIARKRFRAGMPIVEPGNAGYQHPAKEGVKVAAKTPEPEKELVPA